MKTTCTYSSKTGSMKERRHSNIKASFETGIKVTAVARSVGSQQIKGVSELVSGVILTIHNSYFFYYMIIKNNLLFHNYQRFSQSVSVACTEVLLGYLNKSLSVPGGPTKTAQNAMRRKRNHGSDSGLKDSGRTKRCTILTQQPQPAS